ncbi:MAG: hypothetical protein ACRC8S_13090 [Fimbriiglobus sp.]
MRQFMMAGLVLICGLGVISAAEKPLPAFHLKTMPGNHERLLLMRPTELSKFEVVEKSGVREMLTQLMKGMVVFFHGKVQESVLPDFGDIEQVVVNSSFKVVLSNEPSKTSHFSLFSVSCGTVRTTRPHDWSTAVRKTFNTATATKLSCGELWKVPMSMGDKPSYFCLLISDDRTLSFANDEDMDELIERLKHKKPHKPIESWVEECSMVYLDRGLAVNSLEAPRKLTREIDQYVANLVKATSAVTAGLKLGVEPSVRFKGHIEEEMKPAQFQKVLEKFFRSVREGEDNSASSQLFFKALQFEVKDQEFEIKGKLPASLWKPESDSKTGAE